MNPGDAAVMAAAALRRNKVRSFLTVLGIVIGAGSVIAMVHLGEASARSVAERIAAMGSNLLFVRPGADRGRGGLRAPAEPFELEDMEALSLALEGRGRVAPAVTSRATLVYGNANYTAPVTGVTLAYFPVRNWALAAGRVFEDREVTSGAAVCVVGRTVADAVYGAENPIGTTLRVGRTACEVIGLLSPKGAGFGGDQDDVVLMPLKAVQRRLRGTLDVDVIYVSMLGEGATTKARADIETVMRRQRRIRPGQEEDFHVRDMQELAETLESTSRTLTTLLAAIAAVSLLVGGIGIMNIMLVSVTERTREIGIRLAIGALARDILQQFLFESAVLSSLGGAVGVALGIGATWFLTDRMNLPFLLLPEIIALAFLVSVVVGVIFGLVPAQKAAHLSPIDALRHE